MEVFLDFGSLQSYVGALVMSRTQIKGALTWSPVVLLDPWPREGGMQEDNPMKERVRKADEQRMLHRAQVHVKAGRLPLTRDGRSLASLAVLGLQGGAKERREGMLALFRAHFTEGLDIGNMEVLQQVLKKDVVAFGRTEELEHNMTRLLGNGGFATPTFLVGDEKIFVGADRFHLACAVAFPSLPNGQLRLAPRWDGTRRKLTFYFDLASPWSYLGWTQVARITRECQAIFEPVPILLGALFKEIGTPNVPMNALPDAVRVYGGREMDEWRRWWHLPTAVRFPDAFPLRTVLAQRICIVSAKAIAPLYTAAWTQNLNIGDETVVIKVLADAGLDGAALVAAANEDSIKAQLRENTERAKKNGVCGVPTFQVNHGAVVWGQDRLNIVEDLLCGWTDTGLAKL